MRNSKTGGDRVGPTPRRGNRVGADRSGRRIEPALQVQPGEAPALGPAGQRHHPVGNPGIDQRLRADDAAGAPGAGDDDQGLGRRDEIGKTMNQLRAGAGEGARHVKPRIFIERAAVEDGDLLPRAPQPVELLGRDRRGGEFVLDDLGKSLARDIGAGKQPIPSGRPRRGTTLQHMDIVVAEAFEPACRPLGHAVSLIKEDDPTRAPRHQAQDLGLQPAVGDVDREQRMTRSVLALLAHIEKGDLAAIGKPFSQRHDIDGFGHRHVLFRSDEA